MQKITTLEKLFKTLSQFLRHPLIRAVAILQFIIALVIFYWAALMPFDDEPSNIPAWALHLTGNILLALSTSIAIYPFFRLRSIFFMCCALSLAAELSQLLTANRFSDPFDAATNIVGLVIGCTLALPLFAIKNQTSKVD